MTKLFALSILIILTSHAQAETLTCQVWAGDNTPKTITEKIQISKELDSSASFLKSYSLGKTNYGSISVSINGVTESLSITFLPNTRNEMSVNANGPMAGKIGLSMVNNADQSQTLSVSCSVLKD